MGGQARTRAGRRGRYSLLSGVETGTWVFRLGIRQAWIVVIAISVCCGGVHGSYRDGERGRPEVRHALHDKVLGVSMRYGTFGPAVKESSALHA